MDDGPAKVGIVGLGHNGLAHLRGHMASGASFAKLSAFDAIRQDEEIVALVGKWEQAENVC